jgi:hypothetical protein
MVAFGRCVGAVACSSVCLSLMINVYFRGGALAVRYRRVRPPPAMTHTRLNTASRLTVPGRSRCPQSWLIAAPLFVDLISVVRPLCPGLQLF